MKTLLLSFFFSLFSIVLVGQFEMNSTGDIGIGGASPSTTYKLNLKGDLLIQPPSSSNGLEFEGGNLPGSGGYGVIMRPTSSGNGYLGSSSYYFSRTYTDNIFRNNEYTLSDARVKTNIIPINNAIELLMQLEGKIFDYTEDAFPNVSSEIQEGLIERGKGTYGFIAQEVQEVLPKSVVYDEEIDLHHLSTDAIIPLLVEGTKIQQAIIDSLRSEIDYIKSLIENSKAFNQGVKKTNITPRNNDSVKQLNKLFQNYPNPFNEETIINYNLAESTNNAVLTIYDLQGKQLRSIKLSQLGDGSVTIKGGNLQAGMYLYSIIADGQVIDTKQFVLTN